MVPLGFGVATVALRAGLLAPDPAVEGAVRPFDRALLAHAAHPAIPPNCSNPAASRNRLAAPRQYSPMYSVVSQARPPSSAALAVVPHPAQGSTTSCPRSVRYST